MLRHSGASLDFLKQSDARHARKLTSRAMFLPSVVGVEGRRTAGGRASVSISKVKRINQTLAEPHSRTSACHFIGGSKSASNTISHVLSVSETTGAIARTANLYCKLHIHSMPFAANARLIKKRANDIVLLLKTAKHKSFILVKRATRKFASSSPPGTKSSEK